MKAIVMHDYGDANALSCEDVPTPMPGPGQARVRVHASSINPGMVKRTSGALRGMVPDLDFPFIPGSDFSGVVDELGPEVTGFSVGDEVYSFGGPGGSHAEFVVASVAILSRKPSKLTHVEAASLALGLQTAAHLFERAALTRGQSVVFLGAGGAVGHAAVQLAALRGIRLVASATSRSADRVRRLGADTVVTSDDALRSAATGVDAVFNALGGDRNELAMSLLRPGGTLLTLSAPPPADAAQRQVQAEFINVLATDGGHLDTLHDALEEQRITPFVARTFPLLAAQEAWRLFESGGTQGKIVIDSSPVAAPAPVRNADAA